MSDETGPKLSATGILDGLSSKKSGRPRTLDEAEELSFAADYANGDRTLDAVAATWGITYWTARRTIRRVKARLAKENSK